MTGASMRLVSAVAANPAGMMKVVGGVKLEGNSQAGEGQVSEGQRTKQRTEELHARGEQVFKECSRARGANE